MEPIISVTPKQSRKLSRLSLSNHKRKKRHHQRFDNSNENTDDDEFTAQITNVGDSNSKPTNLRQETISLGIRTQSTCSIDEKYGEEREFCDNNENIFEVSYKHDAYVQNLGEIARDILHDNRWSIAGNPLFQWENKESKLRRSINADVEVPTLIIFDF